MKELIKKAYENARNKGFWEDVQHLYETIDDIKNSDEWNSDEKHDAEYYFNTYKNNTISSRLMLIVSEVAEAQEALRKADTDNFHEELADVAIRLFDLCGGLDIDLEAEIIKKMEKNKDRPYKHGKAF